jgi:hypothetical protein
MQYYTLFDIFLFLVYFSLTVAFLFKYSQKYSVPIIRKYFLLGALLKILGGQALCLVYVFYYKYGDTFRYFFFGNEFKDILINDERYNFLQALFMSNEEFQSLISYRIDFAYGFVESSFIVNKITAIFSLLSFESFIVTTLFFSLFSFSGIWKLFVTFTRLYPTLYKEMAWSILFFPSVVFWGSGLLKDSICIGAIGWLTWALYSIFFDKTNKRPSLIYALIAAIISFWLIYKIKTYIILAYMAGFLFWYFLYFRDKIKNNIIRISLTPLIILIGIPILLLALQNFSEELGRYAIENIATTATTLVNALSNKEYAGSTYNLGTISPTIPGMLSKFPLAVNVTLFRPYIWEVRNPVMLFAALESMIMIYVVYFTINNTSFRKSISAVLNNNIIFFTLIYSIIFSFAVGLTSTNFGTLVRYKIPAMPFFAISIVLIYYYGSGGGRLIYDIFHSRKKKPISHLSKP